MSYIGRGTESISNVEVLDNLTFDGSASYTLQKSSVNFVPSSANNLLISISGVVQQGNFSVSGSTITFDTTVSGSDTCDWILHYGTGLITTVADGTITEAKLGSNAVTTAKINNGAITSAKLDSGLGLGKIGQVVQDSYSTSESTTSSSLVDSSLTASITPSATSSKILILLTVNCKVNRPNAETYMGLGIKRDSTQVYTQSLTGFGGYIGGASEYQHFAIQHISYLDSPSTTSSITYTMNYAQTGGGTATVQYGNTNSFFQLMEVIA